MLLVDVNLSDLTVIEVREKEQPIFICLLACPNLCHMNDMSNFDGTILVSMLSHDIIRNMMKQAHRNSMFTQLNKSLVAWWCQVKHICLWVRLEI